MHTVAARWTILTDCTSFSRRPQQVNAMVNQTHTHHRSHVRVQQVCVCLRVPLLLAPQMTYHCTGGSAPSPWTTVLEDLHPLLGPACPLLISQPRQHHTQPCSSHDLHTHTHTKKTHTNTSPPGIRTHSVNSQLKKRSRPPLFLCVYTAFYCGIIQHCKDDMALS